MYFAQKRGKYDQKRRKKKKEPLFRLFSEQAAKTDKIKKKRKKKRQSRGKKKKGLTHIKMCQRWFQRKCARYDHRLCEKKNKLRKRCETLAVM